MTLPLLKRCVDGRKEKSFPCKHICQSYDPLLILVLQFCCFSSSFAIWCFFLTCTNDQALCINGQHFFLQPYSQELSQCVQFNTLECQLH